MTGNYKTKQEEFWAQSFGSEYIGRNKDGELARRLLPFWSDVMRRTCGVSSVLELGSNIGLNLRALRLISPAIELSAVEINEKAAEMLREWGGCEVFQKSILDFEPCRTWELVFTRGVLIHINPDELPGVYDIMIKASSRYILTAEYYNPVPVEIPYRGHDGFLFKRDFAGELMDRTSSLRLVDYGFVYHRDPLFPQDDITWFLMERSK
jgi:spore coat polysaccharide biosynthesis protein SpsF